MSHILDRPIWSALTTRHAGLAEGGAAGLGQRSDLDGLLVEPHLGRLATAPAAGGHGREVTVDGLLVDEPAEQVAAVVAQVGGVEVAAEDEHRLRQHRVRVGQRVLGPRPRLVHAHTAQHPASVLQQPSRVGVARRRVEKEGGSQRRVGHRPREAGPRLQRRRSGSSSARGLHGVGELRGGHAQGPERTSPVVVRAGVVGPGSVGVATVVHEPVVVLRCDDEVEVDRREARDVVVRVLDAGRDDECARHVVDAHAVLDTGHVEQRVLVEAERAGHGDEVAEVERGRHQTADRSRSGRTEPASST